MNFQWSVLINMGYDRIKPRNITSMQKLLNKNIKQFNLI